MPRGTAPGGTADGAANPDADWDRNGTVTSTDIAQFGSREYVAALPQGQLAQPGSATQPAATNTTAAANAARAANARSDFNIGFSGYRFNGDIGAYTVRFRHYDPTPGMCRWLERDPAGYQDGPSLYSYLGRNPMAGTDPSGRFLHVLAGAGIGAVIGGVTAAIMGEDILEGAAKGAVVGAVAGATFGAGLAIAGMKTTAAIVGSSAAAGMAGAAASAFVEGRAPTAEELVVGGVVGLAAPMLGQLVISMARHAIGNVRAAAQAGLQAVRGRRLPQSDTVPRPGPTCFLAGTLVLTASPALAAPIESIEAGATVASIDPATGEATTAIVSATPARLFEGTIYDITVDPGEPGGGDETTISATGEHPFLVARAGPHAAALDTRADPEAVALVEPLDTRDRTDEDQRAHGRWVPASDLAEGDAVRTMSPQGVAGTATVTKIRGRHAVVPVYNLTVEGTSRYLVGACGVVVHNKDPGDVRPNGPTPRVRAVGDALEDWLGPDAKPIVNKHGDLILLSKDGKRKAQFHFKTPHTPDDLPHVHLEVWDDIKEGWIDAIPDRHRIYPGGTSFGG